MFITDFGDDTSDKETLEERLKRLLRAAARNYVQHFGTARSAQDRTKLVHLLEVSGANHQRMAEECFPEKGKVTDARRQLRLLGVFPQANAEDFQPEALQNILDAYLDLPAS